MLYDKYYLAKCPSCGTLMKYNTQICPNCKFPIGKMANNLRSILNYSYSNYGLYNSEFFDFKHDSCIRSIKATDANYYYNYVLPQIHIIKSKYAKKIFNIEIEIDKYNNKKIDSKSLSGHIRNDTYILGFILKFWKFAITDIKSVNNNYGGVVDYPHVRDFDSDTRFFRDVYYEFYRITKGHAGEKKFETDFKNYEKDNNNFKYYIYHNDNIKDSFNIKSDTNNTTQLDTVIISNRGIFIPEMKNYSNPFHVDDNGDVKLDSNIKNVDTQSTNNIMNQVNNHKTAMNKLVISEFNYKPIPVYSFIVDVADSYDGNKYLPIYNIQDCINFITSQSIVLNTDSELNELKKYVESNSKKDKKYTHLAFSHDGIYFIGALLDYLDIIFKFYIKGNKTLKDNK